MSYKPYSEDNPPQVGDIVMHPSGDLSILAQSYTTNEYWVMYLTHGSATPWQAGVIMNYSWKEECIYRHLVKKGGLCEL